MHILNLLSFACALAAPCIAAIQSPFTTKERGEDEGYNFKYPIRKVAIVGAGPSGLIAYRELTEVSLQVRVFERDNVPGGNWHYTEDPPRDAPVPNAPVSLADFVPSLPPPGVVLPYSEIYENGEGEDEWRYFRGPSPVWESLKSNAPAPLQQIPDFPWPAGTQWELTQRQLQSYMRAFASLHGANSNDDNPSFAYNTRVELIEKRLNDAGEEEGWRLWLKELVPDLASGKTRATWWTEEFDAVIVASGRYNAPYMPDIPGLAEWKARFSHQLAHSRSYRRPESLDNKTVLIVGAQTSGAEISRDINKHAKQVLQSIKAHPDEHKDISAVGLLARLPRNTTIVPEIKQFLPLEDGSTLESSKIELVNGTILTGIDHIIFATGYRYSYPFLPQYYNESVYVPREGASDKAVPFIALSGEYLRDLHLDLFYIRDPTLAFLSITFRMQTFTYCGYQSLALAKVWTGTAKLPDTDTMWEMYDDLVKERGGIGKTLPYLGPGQHEGMRRRYIGWLNEAANKYGGKQIDGVPKYTDEVGRYWWAAQYGVPLNGEESALSAYMAGFGGLDLFAEGESQQNIIDALWDVDW
ncbi:FAD/NAD(P)-binding domain-containing protein [Coniophora puteana RWD-64-598 SS2]|uniref:FAD/NAD(P)-binding domain-containing protein n=1 Tax=Coniophora puteana (strain RWD-64-598) TaxID=741705 RepID=A0A5M3MFR3_CONPW|nr:FAD/NAD(P)-binding domain-containing protein [Coniophora puteana RWD-64-598 SS2]EIW77431.1 FAD/NAD(P)-binding domain-containing protein [Coniophora puteana RWD-64-598 SS2]